MRQVSAHTIRAREIRNTMTVGEMKAALVALYSKGEKLSLEANVLASELARKGVYSIQA